MKKILTLIVVLFTTLNLFATDFCGGFKEGFIDGWCYANSRNMYCVPPLPPICPTVRIGESMWSYSDGYKRGYQRGLNK